MEIVSNISNPSTAFGFFRLFHKKFSKNVVPLIFSSIYNVSYFDNLSLYVCFETDNV
jgi:hypothetical protein